MTIRELYEQVRDGRIVSDIALQREIVYNAEKQALVIDSIVCGIPLPAFYLWLNDDGILEVLDGKQRIESIKQFKENNLQYKGRIWRESREIQEQFDAIELTTIVCTGDEAKKREIFRRINTLGVPLSNFEVLNGLFNGEYLRGLTQYVMQDAAARKVLGAKARGDSQYKLLQLLGTLRGYRRDGINDYVAKHKDESFEGDQRAVARYIKFIGDIFDKANNLDIYFALAVKYINDISLWKQHRTEINRRIMRFLKSDDAKLIDNKAREIEDIIQAVVGGISVDDKRLFSKDDRHELCLRLPTQNGKWQCQGCGQWFDEEELTVDHIKPWSKGGRTELSNAQLLCRPCNSRKSNRE